jgi:hypothetical protein
LADPDQWGTRQRSKRADAFSSALSELDFAPVRLEDLPATPKLWTPLRNSLPTIHCPYRQVWEGNVPSSPRCSCYRHLSREYKINGRLFCEQDLDQFAFQEIHVRALLCNVSFDRTRMNKLWKDALDPLAISKLRRSVLKSRIQGPFTQGDPDDELFADMSNSSTSTLESLHNLTDGSNPGPHYSRPYRRYKNNRAQGTGTLTNTYHISSSRSSRKLRRRSRPRCA